MAGAYDLNNDATRVILVDASGNVIGGTGQAANADDQSAAAVGQLVNARGYGFDGTAWDRLRTKANGWQGVTLVRSSDGGEFLALGDSTPFNQVQQSANMNFNNTGFERQRGNVEGTLLASAARTASAYSSAQTNHNARGVLVMVDVTSAGTGTLTPSIRAKNSVSGNYYFLLSGGPITASGRWGFLVYPGAPTVAFGATGTVQSVGHALPRTWFVGILSSDGSSWTYSVDYSLIV